MVLYHGTTHNFDNIDLNYGKPYKDFGKGFYVSQTRSQAVGMAVRNAEMITRREKAENAKIVEPEKWLYTYDFPAAALDSLNFIKFEEANAAWVQFVTLNRTRANAHNYDVVIGPTANDRTNPTIQNYLSEAFGEVGSDAALSILIQLLKPYVLPVQFLFGTEKSVKYLTLTDKERL
jgi:hypothetical protein